MATAQLKRQRLHEEERTQSVAPIPRTLPVSVFIGHQNVLPRTMLLAFVRKSLSRVIAHFCKQSMDGPVKLGTPSPGIRLSSVPTELVFSTLQIDQNLCTIGLTLVLNVEKCIPLREKRLDCAPIVPSQRTLCTF